MKNPESIIADLVRNMNNSKNGNRNIKDWIILMGKKPKIEDDDIDDKKKISLIEKIKINLTGDDEDNLLNDIIEEEVIEDIDNLTLMI
jgi:hypothetical protein